VSNGQSRELTAAAAAAGLVPVTDLDGGPLSVEEAAYGQASKAAATIEAYRADWDEFCDWCAGAHHAPAPAPPAAVSGYLTALARAGAKVSTMSRRMAAVRFFHALQDLPDPTSPARVTTVWEGIRRVHGAPPDQAPPLMPPQLFDLVAATAITRDFRTRPSEPELAGARDRALLLIGFFWRARSLKTLATNRLSSSHVTGTPSAGPTLGTGTAEGRERSPSRTARGRRAARRRRGTPSPRPPAPAARPGSGHGPR
jgi:hypothetical protein